jgi:hypothetical protein
MLLQLLIKKLQAELFKLRELQANCTAGERANFETRIGQILSKLAELQA